MTPSANPASAERRIRDVLPVFQTPFLRDESIDFETLEKEIKAGKNVHDFELTSQ